MQASPTISGLDQSFVNTFIKDLSTVIRMESGLNKKLSGLIRTAIKDTLEAKRADLLCLMARSLKGTPLWSRTKRAIIFALGGYTIEQAQEKRIHWQDDSNSLVEYDAKQNIFILRPNTNARYEEVKTEWYAFLQGEPYTSLKGKTRIATFSARQELDAFIKRLEKGKSDCMPQERQLLLDVLALLRQLDSDN